MSKDTNTTASLAGINLNHPVLQMATDALGEGVAMAATTGKVQPVMIPAHNAQCFKTANPAQSYGAFMDKGYMKMFKGGREYAKLNIGISGFFGVPLALLSEYAVRPQEVRDGTRTVSETVAPILGSSAFMTGLEISSYWREDVGAMVKMNKSDPLLNAITAIEKELNPPSAKGQPDRFQEAVGKTSKSLTSMKYNPEAAVVQRQALSDLNKVLGEEKFKQVVGTSYKDLAAAKLPPRAFGQFAKTMMAASCARTGPGYLGFFGAQVYSAKQQHNEWQSTVTGFVAGVASAVLSVNPEGHMMANAKPEHQNMMQRIEQEGAKVVFGGVGTIARMIKFGSLTASMVAGMELYGWAKKQISTSENLELQQPESFVAALEQEDVGARKGRS